MLFAEFWSFSLFCALALSKAGALVVTPKLVCTSGNTDRTCDDILGGDSPTCEESTQGNIFSNFSIDDTQLIQPSITLTVNSSRIDDQRLHNTGWSGYVVGYKDCTSNPGDLCYISFSQLPYDYHDYVHIVNPDSESESPRVSVGDECSFFGCFVYKEESEYDKFCIKEVRGTILEQNVTILATCDPEHSVENGSIGFAIPLDRTQYIEGTVANVTCDEGFAATYGGVSECQSDGTWNTTVLPTCERQCGELNMIIDGGIAKISDETRIVNTTITVTCYDGYYLSEENTLTCGEDGNWSSPSLSSCLPRTCPDIENATTQPLPVDGGYSNTSVTVTCDQGYTGGVNITCGTDGNWTASLPLCSIIECPELDARVGNGKVRVKRPYNWEYWNVQERHVPVGTVVSVTCDWSYTGDDSIFCGNDGNWSAPLPSCSKDRFPEIIGIVILILTLLITALVFMLIFYKYRAYRNNKIRRFNRYFTIQARKESLDPNFAPINLNPHKKLSISLSIRTTNEYYEITADSVATPMTTTPLHGGVVQLAKSQSVDNVSNLPLAHTNIMATTEPYIKDSDSVSAEPTNRSCSSLPYTPYTQHEKADAGTIATEPSKNGEEHADIVFHLSDSSSGVQSGKGEYFDHSGIGFEFTDTQSSSAYPVCDKPTYEPCPEESTESCFTFDVNIPESKVHSTTLLDSPDSAFTEGQTGTTPHYEGGYTNIPESVTPLSPETRSDVTLAFATVGQPAGIKRRNMSISDSASQLESLETDPPYVNSCHSGSSYLGQYTIKSASSYTGESTTTTDYVAESSVAKSSTGYTGGSSVDISSSEYVSEDFVGNPGEGHYPSHGDLSYIDPDSQYRGTPSSTYLTESDLCNGNDHMPTGPLPARLPGTTQSTTDHEAGSARQTNSGYIALPNTSSTA